jgi:uncharacterized membrane protein
MNAAQVHLALTHMPVILSLTGLIILLIALFTKKQILINTALIILIAAGLFSIPVFLSGEGAEEIVEEMSGVSGSIIEKHEDIAKYSFFAALGTGLVAIFALIRLNARLSRIFTLLVVGGSLITSGLMTYTAHLGGQIRHPEITSGQASAVNEQNEEEND